LQNNFSQKQRTAHTKKCVRAANVSFDDNFKASSCFSALSLCQPAKKMCVMAAEVEEEVKITTKANEKKRCLMI